MPYSSTRRCGCYQGTNFEADSHLLGESGEGSCWQIDSQHGFYIESSKGSPAPFCPGVTDSKYAPDLLLEPIHLDLTLHVDLDQQCLAMDEIIEVRCNVPSKSHVYTLQLDGIGFQHLHASRIPPNQRTDSTIASPRYNDGAMTQSSQSTLDSSPVHSNVPNSGQSSNTISNTSSSPLSFFSLFRSNGQKSKQTQPAKPAKSTPSNSQPSMTTSTTPAPLETKNDSVSFYCTYDGKKVTLVWVGADAFGGGKSSCTELVRLIYLVEKPITGLHFTKPYNTVELEAIEQQQKPLVATSFAVPKRSKSQPVEDTVSRSPSPSPSEKSKPTDSATPQSSSSSGSHPANFPISGQTAGLSPFHSTRPLLAVTDHETERARYWLATIDQPNLRPTISYHFVVKAGLTTLANGEQKTITSSDASDASIVPPWPLNSFSPPIVHPKPPTYSRIVQHWDNPYPTPAYLVCWAVGQLHHVEAIPPRTFPLSNQNVTRNTPDSSLNSSGGFNSTDKSSPKSTTRHGHRRYMSEDLNRIASTIIPGSASNSQKENGTKRALSPPPSGPTRSPMWPLDEEDDSYDDSSNIPRSASSCGALMSSYPSLNLNQFQTDQHHHMQSAKNREQASWIIQDIPMRFYTPRNIPLTTVQLMLSRTPEIMIWLQGRLGLPFPFPIKYYQIVAPELPSAMENITLTSWGSDYLLDATWALEYGQTTESINVHEMAHSYFGDTVGCRYWDHAWLKEGWANYVECLWQEDKYGPDGFAYMLHKNSRLYFKESDKSYSRPIVTNRFDSSWDMYDQHLYRGGSRRIHTLRCLLGDDIFFPAVTDYLRTYSGKLVDTEDFKRIMEKHSHRNLNHFFEQWIYSPGYPIIDASFEYSSHRQHVTITAQQTQMDERRGIKTFDMTIPIDIAYLSSTSSASVSTAITSSTSSITSSSSNSQQISSSAKVKWVRAELVFKSGSTTAHLTIPLPSPPLQVIVDKNLMYCCVFKMDPGFQVLRTMAFHCTSVPHRIWAAHALLERGSVQDVEVVAEMLISRENHWGVLADVVVEFAKQHRSMKAANVLIKLLLSHSKHPARQPKAFMAIALALSQIKDPRIPVAIRQYLAAKKYTSLIKLDEGQIRNVSSTSNLADLAAMEYASAVPNYSSINDNHNPNAVKVDTTNVDSSAVIPYKTWGRLLEALAAQGSPDDEALILEQAERSRYGWLGITRSSALSALSKYQTQTAFNYILEATGISQHQHIKARAGAVSALAQATHNSKMHPPFLSRALHTLHLLLHDATYQIRIAAVHALIKLIPSMSPSTAKESIHMIKHARKSFSNQDIIWLKRKLKLLQGEATNFHKTALDKSAGGGHNPLASSSNPTSSSVSPTPQVTVIHSGGPSLDDFNALKAEVAALKARLTSVEQVLEDSEGDD